MSTSDGRPLTRRQLRELRHTGQTPIIPDDAEAAESVEAPAVEAVPVVEPEPDQPEPAQPEPDPVVEPEPAQPEPDPVVEPEPDRPEPAQPEPQLTRRQLREQERLRTNAMPLVTAVPVPDGADDDHSRPVVEAELIEEPVALAETVSAPVPESAEASAAHVDPTSDARAADAAQDAPVVHADFGANVDEASVADTPASFDQLLTHPQESSGSSSAPSALILDEIPATAALNAPITATGELLITSSHKLPEGFGSSGAARGTTDGREVDAVLIDGEIPLASSPTPIAASNAVSTSKSPGEVIRPPAPEKNHKLILTLGITAGGLGIVVVAAVIVAYTTGVFG